MYNIIIFLHYKTLRIEITLSLQIFTIVPLADPGGGGRGPGPPSRPPDLEAPVCNLRAKQ